MGLTTAISAPITDLAAKLASELEAGRPARASLGSESEPFAWSVGLPPTLAAYVANVGVEGMRFDTVTVTPTATPAAKVPERGQKPTAVAFASTTTDLSKYAGLATWSLEADLTSTALAGVVYQVLAGQVLIAFEADILAALAAAPGTETATGATWAAALLDAQAKVLANGARPGVIVISAADYAALMTEGAGAGGFAMFSDPETGPLGQTLFGSAVHVSAALAAGTAWVLDPASVIVGENVNSPIVTIDPYSKAGTNEISLVADLVAGAAVVSPGAIAEVTKTP